jgi:glycosidase/DNA-binding CsgD family transcriptional regulator
MDTDNIEFSEHEKEVIALLLEGKSNKQIALTLHIAQSTVEYHLKNIYNKLQVSSRTEAVLRLGKIIGKNAPGEEAEIRIAAESKDPAKPKMTVNKRYKGSDAIVATSVIVTLFYLFLASQNPCSPQDLIFLPRLGASKVRVTHQMTNLVWQDQIVYVLDPLNSEQNLADIRQQIPYLKGLGITSVLLGPVFSDQDFKAVHLDLGTNEELRQLIADLQASTNGPRINVILNLQMSTAGDQHPWQLHPSYYLRLWDEQNSGDNNGCSLQKSNCEPKIMTDGTKVDHGFGDFRLPLLNHTAGLYTNTGVYREVKDIIFWLVDNFAIDGIHYATAHYYCAAFWPTFMRDFHERYDQTKPDFWHIAEVFIYPEKKTWQIPYEEFINQTSVVGPIAMDGAYDFPLQTFLQEVAAKGTDPKPLLAHLVQRNGLKEPERLAASIKTLNNSFTQAVEQAGQEKNIMERFRLASVLLMTVNRVPLIQSGNEYGIDFTSPTTRFAENLDESFHKFFKKLIQIRRDHPAFRRGSLIRLDTIESVMSYARQYEGHTYIVVLNLDHKPKPTFEIHLGAQGISCVPATNLLMDDDQNIQSHSASLLVNLNPWEPKIIQCD